MLAISRKNAEENKKLKEEIEKLIREREVLKEKLEAD